MPTPQPKLRSPKCWTKAELQTLRTEYPERGSAITELRKNRSRQSILVMANKLGLKTSFTGPTRQPKLTGQDLNTAIRLREDKHWSFARIGKHFGIAETSASNAILMEYCRRRGHTPAQRTANGRLTDQGIERIRYALKKGLKGVEISLRLGISAACVAEQRRRYAQYLRQNGKAPLPAHGRDQHYSGRKINSTERKQIEALFLAGYGAPKISAATGISKTTCQRLRTKLIKRLRKKGQQLPGCDPQGRRTAILASTATIPAESKQLLRRLLLDRVPVSRAARIAGVGGSSAYKLRDELAMTLDVEGRKLPPPIRPGRVRPGWNTEPDWPPTGRTEFIEFRSLMQTMSFDEAKAAFKHSRRAARNAETIRPKSFQEQLDMLATGKLRLTANLTRRHLEPTMPIVEIPNVTCSQSANI